MDVFDIRDFVLGRYAQYVRSFLKISDDRILKLVETGLVDGRRLWPEALLQLNPSYVKCESVEQLSHAGQLHPLCADIFRRNDQSLRLYRHQKDAIDLGLSRRSFVVTSGTGSGKSLAYFVPIFDSVLRSSPEDSKVHAIVVYPMNALVNSQEIALREYAEAFKARTEQTMPVRFASYTGQQSSAAKGLSKARPPHIILTNYVMLELMLLRQDEQTFVDQGKAELQFLVLDELHTYRGRQGADVAMLVRRLRERCGNPNLTCIGTSATMASGGTPEERRAAVAEFAGKLFGERIPRAHVVEEALRRTISSTRQADAEALRAAVGKLNLPDDWSSFEAHPLSGWIEGAFGLEQEADGHLQRATPISLAAGAAKLSAETSCEQAKCDLALREVLLRSTKIGTVDGAPAFTFKLHQFVAQGGSVYATLEAPDVRQCTMDGQYYAPGAEGHLLYPLLFCRVCGQEYYTVQWRQSDNLIAPRSATTFGGMEDVSSGAKIGYLMLDPEERWQPGPGNYPDHWLGKNGKVKSEYQEYAPKRLHVLPTGAVSQAGAEGALGCWFLPQPFMLCLNCGEGYTRRDKSDFRKLASLSSEGRSTATTLLSSSVVKGLRQAGLDDSACKVLSFTDNRQDASLQAGHFNDFVQVALLRSALVAALGKHRELGFEEVSGAVVEALGLVVADYAFAAELEPSSVMAQQVQKALQDVIEYLLYEDLRRGWRVVQPNLEQCGLLRIGYRGLSELAGNGTEWRSVAFAEKMSAATRDHLLRTLLDEMRRQSAIEASCLSRDYQEKLCQRSASMLREEWALEEGTLRYAASFAYPGGERGEGDYSLSQQSVVGGWLSKQIAEQMGHKLDTEEYNRAVNALVKVLLRYGYLMDTVTRRHGVESRGVRIPAACLVWQAGDGKPVSSPLRRHRAGGEGYAQVEEQPNAFFADFYGQTATELRRMRGAEHTAQVSYERRQEFEERFRKGLLSCLFCSPTMELGIDIADLNAVHMRNIPPTPANYAQRSGRAGRAGQPALVLAYCSSYSGHDQYYFQRQNRMVKGSVVPPRIDLTNEDLLRAHIQAMWLAKTGVDLHESIAELLDLDAEKAPLREEVAAQVQLSAPQLADCLKACREVLASCGEELSLTDWYTDAWAEEVLRRAPQRLDRAFERWRELHRSATEQLDEAYAILRRRHTGKAGGAGSSDPDTMMREAERQRKLLFNETGRSDESDFYPYRYLASEGFLPGYNFPALPVRAFLPKGDDGEYVARARTLAIGEFGPGNTLYHEGNTYQVTRAFLPSGNPEERFVRAKLCTCCGYVYEGEEFGHDRCDYCGVQLTGETCRPLQNLLEMPTMGTTRRQRITCDEEERMRYGYELATHLRFAPAPGGRAQRREASAVSAEECPVLDLTYAPAASLWRVNFGWRRGSGEGSKEQTGFHLDLATGRWQPREPKEDEHEALGKGSSKEVVLFVRHTANSLLIQLPGAGGKVDEALLANLQYALTRGVQEYFQVEESELGSDRVGQGAGQRILLWEAAEGGLGVLRRLVAEPDALARVARVALEILHFNPDTGEDRKPPESDDSCARACYDCLLSYYNQRDHRMLDRHTVKDLLMEMAHSTTTITPEREYEQEYRRLQALVDPNSQLETRLLDALYSQKRRLPDAAQQTLADVACRPDFFYENATCVFCDGSVHDEPQQKAEDETLRAQLRDKGYRVVVIRYDQDIVAQLDEHSDLFGEAVK